MYYILFIYFLFIFYLFFIYPLIRWNAFTNTKQGAESVSQIISKVYALSHIQNTVQNQFLRCISKVYALSDSQYTHVYSSVVHQMLIYDGI